MMFKSSIKSFILIIGLFLYTIILTDCTNDTQRIEEYGVNFDSDETDENNVTMMFLNFGQKRNDNSRDVFEDFEQDEKAIKSKTDILSRLLRIHIDRLRNQSEQVLREIELIFLVDASGSVGLENFLSELNFVRKLLSDFTVDPSAARVAVVTFGGKRNIRRNIDQISHTKVNNDKCYLLNSQLNNISYPGGGTYTRGALMEAYAILEKSRENATKVVFLITDGFSNGGNPRPAANLVKSIGATVFTFGIRTGNVEELHDIASFPGYTHSYLLDSFAEFEALARRALHRDLKPGKYVPVAFPDNCKSLCTHDENVDGKICCDDLATCACGVATGHYACICPTGYFGTGLKGFCIPCPNGTYASGEVFGDATSICTSCPDVNHVTVKVPATSVEDCVCASGFITYGNKCEVVTCPKLKVPENGYLVKASACSNVLHAACGIRCRIGFYLTGDSIQLCGKDGTWSGNEPKCLLKTCPALGPPAYGRMRCQHEEDYQHRIKDDSSAYPIDTRCQFRCETGYQLRGSKIRNCLPLSQWDGLKATCKAITCEPLKQVANGQILPEDCSGPEKVPFSTNCTVTCKKGFVLEGPRVRSCGGRAGVWTQRHIVSHCIDKTPPIIACPADIVLNSLPGENYAYVNWTTPKVIDNVDETPTTWTKPYIVIPWKVKIGTRTVMYIAQDSAGNKARCKFKVKVIDKEPPIIENCIDPPVFFTDTKIGVNVTWDEPGFYDNSKVPVRVEQNHWPGNTTFPIGLTKIIYNATDKYDNVANCVLNITVKDICQDISHPLKGYSKCSSTSDHESQCTISCEEGYGFAIEPNNLETVNDELLLKCNTSNPKWNEDNYVPECSGTYVSKTISQEGSVTLEGNATVVCDNQTTLRELSEYITADLRSTLLDICGNDIECNLISFDPECEENLSSEIGVSSNLIRKRREPSNILNKLKRLTRTDYNTDRNKIKTRKKKDKIEIKFKFIGRIIEENIENPRQAVQKLRQKIESMTQSGKLNLLNNKTNQELAKLALNLHLAFKDPQELCDPGTVLKKHTCVKCPLGTYHDSLSKRCLPCPVGFYEDTSGSVECKRCPENTSTKKMHAKSIRDCIPMCRPGYYSRRKRYNGLRIAVEPCFMCDIGFYQGEYGQTSCLSCPFNTTTKNRGSKDIRDCLYPNEIGANVCQTESCLNGGQCVQEEDSFSCECRDPYIGSKCETFRNSCDSSPCLNEGICNVHYKLNSTVLYNCTCKHGYTGHSCESYIDECATNPCQNGGKCVSTENDYACECKDGFEGQFCEIPVDHCNPSPCEEGSTCRTINETWQCLCKPGFLGRHCNLLPCDWLPCQANSICINIEEENVTRMSYRCKCFDGYTGKNCTIKINHCESSPCLNNGTCINGVSNYTCTCRIPFTGRNCETELSSDYVLHFVKSGTTDYIGMKGPVENLSELTVCLWLQSKDTYNYGTVLSYATRYYDNAFTLTDYNGFVIYINGQKVVTDIKVNNGHWHFLCVTWESRNGAWSIFIDGFMRDNGTRLAEGNIIQGNGSLVIGQEQDRVGGGFSESESFLGQLTLLDIWNTTLTEKDIKYLFSTCEKYYGNVIAWLQMKDHIHGDVVISSSSFCGGCPLPVAPFKGNINVSEDSSEVTYYCDTGYIVRFRGRDYEYLKHKCLKQGQWEGYYMPICIRKKCGFPGYFPRGRIHGKSYLFGDEIYYSCTNGYELRGNPHRICNSEGKWAGFPPFCMGKTCKNLLAPENGDIEYIIEENERDDTSILQAGQQLEFKCDSGFRRDGERFLTCLESGLWDHERPTCILNGCPVPNEVEYNNIEYTVSTNPNNFNDTVELDSESTPVNDTFIKNYHFGDVIEFSCYRGYKFRGNHSSTDFKLVCTENGTWNGFVPECVPLRCPWPSVGKGGTIFLKTQNNDSTEISTRIEFDDTNAKGTDENGVSKNAFVLGAEILLVCDSGYKLVEEGIRTCSDEGTWSPTVSFCEPRECSVIDHPLFGSISNETISENDTSIWINDPNENWKDLKNYSDSYGNIRYFIEGTTYMEKIILTCANDGEMNLNFFNVSESVSNLTWTCNENGEWVILDLKLNNIELDVLFNNTQANVCEERMCTSPLIPEHGYIVSESSSNNYSKTINSTVTYKCRHGYIIEGDEKSVCLSNSSWSSIPSCKSVTCGRPPSLANAVVKEDNIETGNFTFGNMVIYQCIPGYKMFGQPNARCLANGKWSRIHSKCSRLSCNKPKLQPGVIVYGRSYLYQDQLTYVCPNGKKRGFITCKADGNWSDPPICNVN